MIVRYEDLRAAPEATLGRILEFLGTPATEAQIADAVEFASYDNMKRMEQQRVFWLSGAAWCPRTASNPTRCGAARSAIATTSTPPAGRGDRSAGRDDLDPLYGYTRATEGQGGDKALEGAA